MTEPISTPQEDNLQDIKVSFFRNGKLIAVSFSELPQTLQRTAYAILLSSDEF